MEDASTSISRDQLAQVITIDLQERGEILPNYFIHIKTMEVENDCLELEFEICKEIDN